MHLHNCRCFQGHLRMLLQSLRAHCKAPGGAGSIWKYLKALVRATRVSGRFACGFRTDLHFADVWYSYPTSCACCLIVLYIRLLQSPGALTHSEVSLLSLNPFLFRCHCSLAAMKEMLWGFLIAIINKTFIESSATAYL